MVKYVLDNLISLVDERLVVVSSQVQAEKYYRRSLDLDPVYIDALYGISVLLAFELGRPVEAKPYLEKILSKEKDNIDAMFVLAGVYYSIGQWENALELYDEIAKKTKLKEKKNMALENKRKIEDEIHGTR